MARIYARHFVCMSWKRVLDTLCWRPLIAQLSCHRWQALLTSPCCVFSSGENQRLAYSDGFATSMCWSMALVVQEMSLSTVLSSLVIDWIKERGAI